MLFSLTLLTVLIIYTIIGAAFYEFNKDSSSSLDEPAMYMSIFWPVVITVFIVFLAFLGPIKFGRWCAKGIKKKFE